MPSYNPGFSLFLAIKSVLNQTFTDFELIILDDGSSDNSIDIAKSFNDPRIRIYCDGINRGLSYRLNQGISLSRADYIARMDADDLCFPNRFEVQFNYLIFNSDIDLVSCKVVTFNGSDYSLIKFLPYEKYHSQLVSKPWKTIPMPHPTWMGKASWFKKYKYKTPEIVRAEDQELLLRTYPVSTFHSIPEVLLAYRQADLNVYKRFIARKSLLLVQIRFFIKRLEFINLIISIGCFLIKVESDFLVATKMIGDFSTKHKEINLISSKFKSLLKELTQK